MTRTYAEFRRQRERGEIRCLQVVQEFLHRIESRHNLNAFITVTAEAALQAAEESDARFDAGAPRPLEGCVVAVKDNISTRGARTTCASRILENFVPVYDATAVERLRAAGAIIVGKTNLDEFAMGSSTEYSAFGPAHNPHNPDYVPGGSSGGSAVAVAAELCHVALGSDTGGSVRQPAAFCAVIGFKPSYGRISRYGLVAFASSLDQIGVFAHTVEDVASVLDVISGYDVHDATSLPEPPTQSRKVIEEPLVEELRLGVLPEDVLRDCHDEVYACYHRCLKALRAAGVHFTTVTLPYSHLWVPTYYIIATAEASSNLARYDGIRYGLRVPIGEGDDVITATRTAGFGAEVKRRIMMGTYVLSAGYYDAYYRKAQKARRLIAEAYAQSFASVHALLLPTSPIPPFRLGERMEDPIAMYLADYFTVSANLAGIPAISLPAGWTADGLPIGLQLQAPYGADARLLRYARSCLRVWQQNTNSSGPI
ncbi:MAG: Asp-tRNA(Asn)/Glu-tRNA(Gln) amidotransferase subunit GatA [Candidatus Kapabacteria bacterium]|nr:Asp-tRNA(Asn)/Glu-tRNA(Gln) amidotransferase subunit GatA [Candidatus Kapabacteria bacterium]MDW7997123.1 Asp-tRNA(Asn)/Glu-tRNA(Gln) amidotransferase subunit GatA [Bacteroidota bacterium]